MPLNDAIKNAFLCHPQRQNITCFIPPEDADNFRQAFIKAFLDSPVPPVMETFRNSPLPILETFLWAMKEMNETFSKPFKLKNEFESPVAGPLSDILRTAYGNEVIVTPTDFEIREVPIRLFNRKLQPNLTNGRRHPLYDLCLRAMNGDSAAIKELVNRYGVWAKTLKEAEYDPVRNKFKPVFTEQEYKEGLLFDALHRQRRHDPLPVWMMEVSEDCSPLPFLRGIAKNARYTFEHVYRGNPKKSDLGRFEDMHKRLKGGITEGAEADRYAQELTAGLDRSGLNTVTTYEETLNNPQAKLQEDLMLLKMEADSVLHRINSLPLTKDLKGVLWTIATEHGEATFHEAATILLGRQGADRVRQELHRKKPVLADLLDFLRKTHGLKNN
jgi:hypothetical protein